MTSSTRPVAIIGAGVSGLTCALHLQRAGLETQLLEASDRVGGRVRSDRVEGFLIDRGFQVLLTAYPEVRATLDLEALDLGCFAPGGRVRIGDRFATLSDPLRRPADALATLFSGVASPLDALRVLRWRRRVRRGDPADLLRPPHRGALAALRAQGFSDRMIERFLRPFFAGIFLDRDLRGSSGALDYFFRMFSEGEAALPADGMEAIPVQLAAQLAPGTIRTHSPVAALDRRGVTLVSGERIDAEAVVVATDASVAAKLIPGLPEPRFQPACCLSFDAPSPPPVGPFLVLDGDGRGPVNHLCVPSEVAPGYAPAGRSLVSASVLAPVPSDDAALEAAVRRQLGEWFGDAVRHWRLLRIDRVPRALPSQGPGQERRPPDRGSRLDDGLYVCGDHVDLASLQGAMASGRRAAREVQEDCS